MEIKLDIEFNQVLNILKQLSVSEWDKLKIEIENELAKKHKESKTSKREFGCMKGVLEYMAEDFDAPLDDFKEYME